MTCDYLKSQHSDGAEQVVMLDGDTGHLEAANDPK